MVNLLTGQKGSGKTQLMIESANKKVKECVTDKKGDANPEYKGSKTNGRSGNDKRTDIRNNTRLG